MIAGALTPGELALLRTRPQRTQLYLAIAKTHSVYVAQVNGTPASCDGITAIPFYNGAGTLTDVKRDMLLCVGTFPGLWDIGMCRIRRDAVITDTSFYIGITSEIDFVGDYWLMVLDSYSIWPRHPYIDPITEISYMDYDIAYTSQNAYGPPVPIMGTHAVLELTGVSVSANFDASDSYVCIGVPDSIDYWWSCDGAFVFTPAASDTDIAFLAAGTYLVYLLVTANYTIGSVTLSVPSTAVRYVIVHDAVHPLNSSFSLDSCSGSYDSGDWQYRITMNANAGEADVMDRSLAILVARDWYGSTEQSIGPFDTPESIGRNNIVCVGWIDGESIRRSNDKSLVSFDVRGPAFWLGSQQGFPTGIDDTNAAPTDWLHIDTLTPRRGIFSFLHWRSTATVVMDCWITNDAHRLATTYTPADSLLEQLRAICDRVNAKAVADRYSRLFCEIDTQFIDPTLRIPPTFPVVQTMLDRDWRDEITIERRTVDEVGQVDLSGVFYSGNIATSNAIFSLAPGHYPRHYGEKRQVEKIALTNQAEANLQAGLWLGYLNNEFPNIDTPFSSSYRAVDIAPRMFVQMNLAAGDTPRGLVWTNKKLIPREVSFNHDGREALLLTDVTFEAETFPSDATTGDPPITPPDPPIPPTPPLLCNDPTAINYGLELPCRYTSEYDIVCAITTNHVGRSLDFYTATPATNVTWTDIKAGLPVGATMYNLQVGGTAGWLIVIDAGSYDLYYCDISAAVPTWSLVLTTAQARLYANVWVGHLNQAMAVTDGGVCYLAAQLQAFSNILSYWRCVAGAVAGFENVNTGLLAGSCTGAGPADAACDDGTDVYLSAGHSAVGNQTAWISPTLGTFQFLTDGNRIAYAISSGHYNIGGGFAKMYTLAGVFVRNDAFNLGQLTEASGHTFWIRDSDKFLMIDNAIQAVPNDTDGGVGTFSIGPGATGAAWYAFGPAGYSEILWVASSAAISNSKRSIAYTSNGGVTWETRDGNWAAVFGAWEGGINAMIRTAHSILP
jgi:hypothetical protein